MEKKVTIDLATGEKSNFKRSNPLKEQNGSCPHQKAPLLREETHSNIFDELDNGPIMTTSEILDFSSGVDSTEYDN